VAVRSIAAYPEIVIANTAGETVNLIDYKNFFTRDIYRKLALLSSGLLHRDGWYKKDYQQENEHESFYHLKLLLIFF
jgi:hypothetical protein